MNIRGFCGGLLLNPTRKSLRFQLKKIKRKRLQFGSPAKKNYERAAFF